MMAALTNGDRTRGLEPDEVTLISSDDQGLVAKREHISRYCKLLRGYLKDFPYLNEVPVHKVESKVLAKILVYIAEHCKVDIEEGKEYVPNDDLRFWDHRYLDDADPDMLVELLKGADYLDCHPLLHLVAQRLADIMRSRPTEEVRVMFHITNDYTPEEEDEMRREVAECFD